MFKFSASSWLGRVGGVPCLARVSQPVPAHATTHLTPTRCPQPRSARHIASGPPGRRSAATAPTPRTRRFCCGSSPTRGSGSQLPRLHKTCPSAVRLPQGRPRPPRTAHRAPPPPRWARPPDDPTHCPGPAYLPNYNTGLSVALATPTGMDPPTPICPGVT